MERMDKKRKKPKAYKNLAFWLITGIIIIVFWSLLQSPKAAKNDISFTQFLDDVENERVGEVTITGSQITGKYLDQTEFKTVSPPQFDGLVPILRAARDRVR